MTCPHQSIKTLKDFEESNEVVIMNLREIKGAIRCVLNQLRVSNIAVVKANHFVRTLDDTPAEVTDAIQNTYNVCNL